MNPTFARFIKMARRKIDQNGAQCKIVSRSVVSGGDPWNPTETEEIVRFDQKIAFFPATQQQYKRVSEITKTEVVTGVEQVYIAQLPFVLNLTHTIETPNGQTYRFIDIDKIDPDKTGVILHIGLVRV